MHISFLTPRLPPAVCGVGDHTARLAEALHSEGVKSSFFVCRPGPPTGLPTGPVHAWSGKPADLETALRHHAADWLWVQLSGYGYSRWGAPYRLGSTLLELKRRLPGVRIAVYLHETHCGIRQLGWKGPILSPWQRYTVGRVARLADVVFTSNQLWRDRAIDLYGIAPRQVVLLAVGATIPPAAMSAPERRRQRQSLDWKEEEVVGIVFGSSPMQLLALERFQPLLRKGLEAGALDRVVCVGGEPGAVPAELRHWQDRLPGRLEILGHRAAEEIGTILACSDFAFPATPRALLDKSTAFAAMAEAGLAVIASTDPLPPSEDDLPILSAESWDWDRCRSEAVTQVREALRRRAQTHSSWKSIAERALAVAVEPPREAHRNLPLRNDRVAMPRHCPDHQLQHPRADTSLRGGVHAMVG